MKKARRFRLILNGGRAMMMMDAVLHDDARKLYYAQTALFVAGVCGLSETRVRVSQNVVISCSRLRTRLQFAAIEVV